MTNPICNYLKGALWQAKQKIVAWRFEAQNFVFINTKKLCSYCSINEFCIVSEVPFGLGFGLLKIEMGADVIVKGVWPATPVS